MGLVHLDNIDDYADFTDRTAIYPDAGLGTWNALSYVGLGLGEIGEIQGKLKKVIRDDNGEMTAERREAIIAEMGDGFWYLARMCRELGVLPSQVITANVNKLFDRKKRDVLKGSGDNR